MRIKIQQFLFGKSHSWSLVGQETGKAFIKNGHEVDFISTDGFESKFVQPDINHSNIKKEASGNYDLQFSYTAMKNFPSLLDKKWGGKRFGMWTYEFDVLPDGFAKYAQTVDKFLVPSSWFKEICIQNKIDSNKIEVIPHGVDWDRFKNAEPMVLKTDKKVKILVNFAQPHIRKNIYGTLEAFGKAFNKTDDVCLVLKVKDKKPEQQFEVSFAEEFKKFNKNYKNHAECLILKDFIPSIESLYKACDILFMIPNAEGFFLPAIEALAAEKIVITSGYGGQLDFLNNDNSILIGGKETRADKRSLYWTSSPYAKWFSPDINEAAEKLRDVAFNIDKYKTKIILPDLNFKEKFSWTNIAKRIVEIDS